MKKLIATLLLAVILCTNLFTAAVFADGEEQITLTPNGDTITFTVEVGTNCVGFDCIAMLYRPQKSAANLSAGSMESVLAGASQGVVDSDGKASFTFEIDGGAGFYTFTADVPRVSKQYEKSVPFAPASSVNALISELAGMTYGDSAKARTKKLFTETEFDGLKGEEILGLSSAENYSLYEAMSASEKESFYDYLAYKFCAMEGNEEKADVWSIFAKTALLEAFFAMEESEQINALKTNAEKLGLSELVCYSELFAKEPYNTEENIEDMLSELNDAIKDNEDKDNLAVIFSDAMAMSTIANASTDGEVGNIIAAVADYLKEEYELDSDYENATNHKKLWNLAASADTISELVKTINDNISFKEETKKNTSSSGGSGGSGKTVAVRTEAVSAPVPLSSAFSDIENVAWAKDAIEALADKGIISGKEAGKFYPNDELKREELAKILTLAFGVQEQESEMPEFGDIDASAWYYSYVKTMYTNSIIKGMGDVFGTGLAVTREDAATMIYRLIKDTTALPEDEAEEFADNDEISDYAKEAVYSLKKLNIIGGVGDNCFAPKKTVTRAELAKIIYSVTQKGEE